MHSSATAWLLVAWRLPSVAEAAILCGLGFLTTAVILLVGTQWGQSRPLSKCIALSLIAHLLLATYAFCTHVLFHNPAATNGYQKIARVRLEDESSWDDTIPATSDAANEDDSTDDVQVLEPQEAEPDPLKPDDSPSQAPPLIAVQPEPVENPLRNEVEPVATPAEPSPLAVAESTPSPVASDTPARFPDANATAAEIASAASVTPPPTPITTTTEPVRAADGEPLPSAFSARVSDHSAQLAKYGGNADTEFAVQSALMWLAKSQSADGRWDPARFGAGRETKTLGHDRGGCGAKASTGVTALAILAFLGNGETHLTGEHRENVQHGLEFLIASQAQNGSLAGEAEFFAAMYCHSISLLALGEAHAMTGDRRLEAAIVRGVEFSVGAQHSTGSWRYRPQEPGDMSQFGWQAMALRSVKMGQIKVPEETITRMKNFLERCSLGPARGLASYRPGDGPSRTMTAEALACRYFLQSSNSPAAIEEAARYIGEEPPGGRMNLYYWYYGTVAMFQRGGKDWERWNEALKPALLNAQRSDGELAGSWDPDIYWGGYGGRVFSTALGALCLETYYRHLPVILEDEERDLRWTNLPGLGPK